MILKPKFGSPCNSCGQCCREELCFAAEIAFPGQSAPCPALKTQPDGRQLCGIVLGEIAAGLQPIVAIGLGVGSGCGVADPDTTDMQERAWSIFAQAEADRQWEELRRGNAKQASQAL